MEEHIVEMRGDKRLENAIHIQQFGGFQLFHSPFQGTIALEDTFLIIVIVQRIRAGKIRAFRIHALIPVT